MSVRCLHSHSHTNRASDLLNDVDPPPPQEVPRTAR